MKFSKILGRSEKGKQTSFLGLIMKRMMCPGRVSTRSRPNNSLDIKSQHARDKIICIRIEDSKLLSINPPPPPN